MSKLFEATVAGELKLPNRIIMAPLTRARAGESRIPNELMREYYVQRASAGLILTEATSVTPMGVGYVDTPGIWSEEQISGWKNITKGVHEAGGRILLQLWHVGRISDPSLLGGALPIAPSAIAAKGNVSLLRPERPYVIPRALERKEISEIIESYKIGAENAMKAGFDGVELHGANGYLLDQFLQSGSNLRTDDYGGSIENRARLLLEVTDAAIKIFGAGRVGVHIAPRSDSHSMEDSNPLETFSYVARELGKRKIAFICAREKESSDSLGPKLKKVFGGHYIANEGFTRESAEFILEKKDADSVAFGRDFISNPDLPARLKNGMPLNPVDYSTLYSPGPNGYVDYPSLS